MTHEIVDFLRSHMNSFERVPMMAGPFHIQDVAIEEVHVSANKLDRVEIVDVHMTFMCKTYPETLKRENHEEKLYRKMQEESGVPSMLMRSTRNDKRED